MKQASLSSSIDQGGGNLRPSLAFGDFNPFIRIPGVFQKCPGATFTNRENNTGESYERDRLESKGAIMQVILIAAVRSVSVLALLGLASHLSTTGSRRMDCRGRKGYESIL